MYQVDFFLEIQRLTKKGENFNNFLISKSLEKKIPLVATNENFFIDKS